MPDITLLRFATLVVLAAPAGAGQLLAQETSMIRHVVVHVPAQNDEWTSTRLVVAPDDILLIRVAGLVRLSSKGGDVDIGGVQPRGTVSTGNGVLEFRIGGAARGAIGQRTLRLVDQAGELELRVRDDRYDDNDGSFTVDVVVIPTSAIPPPASGTTADALEGVADPKSAILTPMRAFLRDLATAEEVYFSERARYTARARELALTPPPGVALESLVLSSRSHGWSAIVATSALANVRCGLGMGVPNPLVASAGEGVVVCQ